MVRKQGVYFNDFGEQDLAGHRPITFHPFPWKLGFNGVVDQFGDRVTDCRTDIARIIVEAVNKQNKTTYSRVKKPNKKSFTL